MRAAIITAIEIASITAIVVGIAMIHVPAAWIVGGLIALGLAVGSDR